MNNALLPLADYHQFIIYRAIPSTDRPGKLDKLPIDHRSGRVWNAHDPAIWTDEKTARAAASRLGTDYGIAFVLTISDPFFCIDIDHCRLPDNSDWTPFAYELVKRFPNAAVETSCSGVGLHIWGRYNGTAPPHKYKNGKFGIELYTELRFIALGHPGANGNASIDCTLALSSLITDYFPASRKAAGDYLEWTEEPCPEWSGYADDNELIEAAKCSKSNASVFGGKASFADLWTANEDALARTYPSAGDIYDRSRADAALASHLAFWTGRDCARIERLMRLSNLVRDKWERDDYMKGAISFAVSHCRDVYKGHSNNQSTVDINGITMQEIDWPSPVSLTTAMLPPWPDDVFPDSVQQFVRGLAESTETPLELPALLVLASIAAAAQGKYRVRVKDDYFEPVNIWTCVALPPATRKTAVQTAATAPLTAWERAQREIFEPLIRAAQSECETIDEQLKELRKAAKKAEGDEFERLKTQITEIESKKPVIPILPQIWAQDVTTEKLGAMMADNNGRMAVMSDEAGIFDILAGRYSSGVPNIDLYLQGHAGDPVKVDRGNRPSIFMQSPTLTLGLSPQPEVLRGMTENPSFRGRGLLGRFLYAVPPSNLGYRTLNSRPLSDEIKQCYESILTAILNHQMASNNDEPVPHILKLSYEAEQARSAFSHKIEAGMREGGIYAYISDWAGKFSGAVVRIAALLHITRHVFGKPSDHEISLEDMDAALRMADSLSAHALAAFDLMGADPALDGARHVLRWIEREGKPEFTFRDCHHAHKARYRRTKELEPVIEVLTERHYIRQNEKKVAHRPSRWFDVNPAII